VLILAACALAGCGRKGPLDLPPGASALDQGEVIIPDANSRPQQSADSNLLGGTSSGGRNQIVAPKGPNKRIPLDALLD